MNLPGVAPLLADCAALAGYKPSRLERTAMTDETGGANGADDADGTERLWLVDRQYRDENLITLVYASTDGERFLQKQLSHQMLMTRPVTAAVDADADRIEATPADEDRDRYATQASEMAAEHDPDDEV